MSSQCHSHGSAPLRRRGQLSLEALLAFSILLSALSVLIFAAQGMGQRLAAHAGESSARYAASYSALCLDEAAQSMAGSSARIAPQTSFTVRNNGIYSDGYPSVSEGFFHDIKYDSGRYRVQSYGIEPA